MITSMIISSIHPRHFLRLGGVELVGAPRDRSGKVLHKNKNGNVVSESEAVSSFCLNVLRVRTFFLHTESLKELSLPFL